VENEVFDLGQIVKQDNYRDFTKSNGSRSHWPW